MPDACLTRSTYLRSDHSIRTKVDLEADPTGALAGTVAPPTGPVERFPPFAEKCRTTGLMAVKRAPAAGSTRLETDRLASIADAAAPSHRPEVAAGNQVGDTALMAWIDGLNLRRRHGDRGACGQCGWGADHDSGQEDRERAHCSCHSAARASPRTTGHGRPDRPMRNDRQTSSVTRRRQDLRRGQRVPTPTAGPQSP